MKVDQMMQVGTMGSLYHYSNLSSNIEGECLAYILIDQDLLGDHYGGETFHATESTYKWLISVLNDARRYDAKY